ncbi:MAG: cytochrome P450 [Polyangiaceae bacterium]
MGFPPGPRWPSVIQTFLLLKSGQRWVESVSRRHGDLFTLRTLVFGTQVWTSDPALIQQIFTGDVAVLHAGEANSTARLLTGDTSVLVLDEAPHKRMRKLLTPPFHGERMTRFAEEMGAVTRKVMSGWPADRPFSLLPSMQRITMEVIVANVLGLREGPRREELRRKLGALMDTVASPAGAFFLIPSLQRDLGPFTPWRRLKRIFDELERVIYREIAERRAEVESGAAAGRDDVLTMLLEARDEGGQGMSDREIRDQINTLVVAGHETTATTLAWAFERVLSNPQVLDRLLREIEAATASGKSDAADLARLEYLDAIVKEVMRQRPSVPMLGRKLTRPMTLRGHEIPAGAMVTAAIYLTHRRPDLYPEPEAFQPERFLGKKMDPYTYFPFGGGPRRCLGAAFATQEIKIVLGTVLGSLRLKLAREAPLPVSPRSVFMGPLGGTEVHLLGPRAPAMAA